MANDGPRPRIPNPARNQRWSWKLVAVSAVICAVALVSVRTNAAFTDTTGNGPSSIAAGSVDLVDDDAGAVLFTVAGMVPTDTVTRCITVTYQGTVTPASVRIYGSVGGTGLATYLDTTVEVGTGGTFASCTGFSPSSTLFSGTLAAFATSHSNWTNGLAAFSAAANPTTRTFRITVTLQDDNGAQAKTATPTFTWETQAP
jgi:predicted ribosomally synthesized peptide with SipW-like signal peptide